MGRTTEKEALAMGLGRCAWGNERGKAESLLRRLAEYGAITEDDLRRCLRLLPQVTPDPHRWGLFAVDMLAKPRDILADLKEWVPRCHEWAKTKAPEPPPKRRGRPPKVDPRIDFWARAIAVEIREKIAAAWVSISSKEKADRRGDAILEALDRLRGPFGDERLECIADNVAMAIVSSRMEKAETCADEITRVLLGFKDRRSVRDLISYRKQSRRK